MNKKTLFWVAFWVVAALMRILPIDGASLWYDEIFTYQFAHLSLRDLFMATTGDVHPPLYYVVVWMFYRLFPGAPDWAARIPSLFASLGSLYLFWQVLKGYPLGNTARYGAMVLMAVIPFQIHYAIEARMYALLQFEFLFGVLMVQNRRWHGVTLAMSAMAYTQNYGLFYCVLLFGLAVLRNRADLKRVFYSSAAAAITYIPWVPSFFFQLAWSKEYGHWIQPVTPGAVIYAIQNLFGGYYAAKPFGLALPVVVLVALMLGTLRGRKDGLWDILLLAWGVIGLAVLVSLAGSPILLFRPLVGSSPFLYLLTVLPLERAFKAHRLMPIAVILFFVPSLVGSVYGFYTAFASSGKSDIVGSETVAWVRERYQPGDVVLAVSDGPLTIFRMYAPDMTVYKFDVPIECEPLGALSGVTRGYMGYTEQSFDNLPAGRVWLVNARTALSRGCEIERVNALIGDNPPARIFQDDDFVFVGVWELQR